MQGDERTLQPWFVWFVQHTHLCCTPCSRPQLGPLSQTQDKVVAEICLMKSLHHPLIVRLHEVIDTDDDTLFMGTAPKPNQSCVVQAPRSFLLDTTPPVLPCTTTTTTATTTTVLQYCDAGTATDWDQATKKFTSRQTNGVLTELIVKQIAVDVIDALQYCTHSHTHPHPLRITLPLLQPLVTGGGGGGGGSHCGHHSASSRHHSSRPEARQYAARIQRPLHGSLRHTLTPCAPSLLTHIATPPHHHPCLAARRLWCCLSVPCCRPQGWPGVQV